MRVIVLRAVVAALMLTGIVRANSGAPHGPALLGGRSLVHAHNAYADGDKWRDQLNRALSIGQVPVVVEQDIAFAPRNEASFQSVVSHAAIVKGSEPTLEEHFFDRIRPIMDKAVAAGQKHRWPLVVLHLDFKTNEREHHRAVWDLLRRHRAWLSTAKADVDSMTISPIEPGPLLVLTENGAGQERDFSEWAGKCGTFFLFGSIPPPAVKPSDDAAERARILRAAGPHQLIPTSATTYRRWVNFPWAVIEESGPSQAGEWTGDDQRRLEAVVNYAHQQRLLVRFYTLNGHTATTRRGWTPSYNFGSLDAVRVRWRAAINSRVDLIATDQYEELAAQIRAAAQ